MYSLVAGVPFSPVDLDIAHLARGEWNALTDRFRIWFLPNEDGSSDQPVCYVVIRKFDPRDGVLLYAHVVVNIAGHARTRADRDFTVGIMSNDDVKARSMLNSILEIPPSYHRRNEVKLIERKWRDNPETVMRFLANIHSAMKRTAPGGKVFALKFELPAGMTGELGHGLGAWWE